MNEVRLVTNVKNSKKNFQILEKNDPLMGEDGKEVAGSREKQKYLINTLHMFSLKKRTQLSLPKTEP